MGLLRLITGLLVIHIPLFLGALPAHALDGYQPIPHDAPKATLGFQPLVTTEDYIVTCGDYQNINLDLARQRLSKNWQRCYSYTAATLSTLHDMESTTPIKQFCVPPNVSPEYAMDLAIKYSVKLPKTKKENPARIILEALAVRYPC